MKTFDNHDRNILRTLAKQIAEEAARPDMDRRRRLWVEHNSLRSTYPMMLVFPEGAWVELLPDATLKCQGEEARRIEWALRARLYTAAHFQDDTVVEAEWVVYANFTDTGWGLEPVCIPSSESRGAFRIQPVLLEPSDLQKLRHPDLVYDEAAHLRRIEQAGDLFGDILAVKPKGTGHMSYHLFHQYIYLRGETAFLEDLTGNPGMVHAAMNFFMEGHQRLLQQMIERDLLSLNNDNTYQSSGGNGYTDQLPAPGFDPQHVRPCDLWASAEAQELAVVSPRMQREFAIPYESRLLAPFGLNGYGCCDDLARKLPDVMAMPNMRRISISPFSNVDRCAEQMKGAFIFNWKPQPAHLVGDFDPSAIRAYLRHTLDVCQANGCVLEMVLKDTHTCEHHPERFAEWTRIGRELILETAGEPPR
jgi:hypothetical protein